MDLVQYSKDISLHMVSLSSLVAWRRSLMGSMDAQFVSAAD